MVRAVEFTALGHSAEISTSITTLVAHSFDVVPSGSAAIHLDVAGQLAGGCPLNRYLGHPRRDGLVPKIYRTAVEHCPHDGRGIGPPDSRRVNS